MSLRTRLLLGSLTFVAALAALGAWSSWQLEVTDVSRDDLDVASGWKSD